MPNIKSAKKRVKIIAIRTKRNSSIKTRIKTAIKKFEDTLNNGNLEDAKNALIRAVKIIDKAAGKGVIHKNTAARKKSNLYKKFNRLQNVG
ncbi:MAG: small subunit ribosomal protein [Thermosediminibacterales bacterium]|nr:small subunit ribosomal protein [Thermosediminibacterales bacterium]MDK2835770.1 small subunit ribosomal protein [Thermosediminibacterales bacterium]